MIDNVVGVRISSAHYDKSLNNANSQMEAYLTFTDWVSMVATLDTGGCRESFITSHEDPANQNICIEFGEVRL